MAPETAILVGIFAPLAVAALIPFLSFQANLRDAAGPVGALFSFVAALIVAKAVMTGASPSVTLVTISEGLDLTFRVTKPNIVFNQFGLTSINHQACIQYAFKRRATGNHALDCRFNDLRHDTVADVLRQYGRWRVGTHAAGIGACITISNPLVILSRCEWDRGPAIDKSEETSLLAHQEFFNHDFTASRTK